MRCIRYQRGDEVRHGIVEDATVHELRGSAIARAMHSSVTTSRSSYPTDHRGVEVSRFRTNDIIFGVAEHGTRHR